jgi:hypothetical protein
MQLLLLLISNRSKSENINANVINKFTSHIMVMRHGYILGFFPAFIWRLKRYVSGVSFEGGGGGGVVRCCANCPTTLTQ